MVHWLDDAMPLQSGGDACAVLMRRDPVGQWGGRCHRLPVVEARWRFEEGVTVLRLCADHADILVRRYCGGASAPVVTYWALKAGG